MSEANLIERPQLIDYYPSECNGIKHIKGTLYESYLHVTEEVHLTDNIFENLLEHALADIRSRNYFVKSIYRKYVVMSTGHTIYAFELVKLKEPIFRSSVHITSGVMRAMIKSKI